MARTKYSNTCDDCDAKGRATPCLCSAHLCALCKARCKHCAKVLDLHERAKIAATGRTASDLANEENAACVPALRQENAKLRAENDKWNRILAGQNDKPTGNERPSDLVPRRVTVRRDRWESVVSLANELKNQRGLDASPGEVAAIVIDAGLNAIKGDAERKASASPRAFEPGTFKPLTAEEAETLKNELRMVRADREEWKAQAFEARAQRDANAQLMRERDERIKQLREEKADETPFAWAHEDLRVRTGRDLPSDPAKFTDYLVSMIAGLESDKEAAEGLVEEANERAEDSEALKADLASLAQWCFSMGATLTDLSGVVSSNEAHDVLRNTECRSMPSMPGECFLWQPETGAKFLGNITVPPTKNVPRHA